MKLYPQLTLFSLTILFVTSMASAMTIPLPTCVNHHLQPRAGWLLSPVSGTLECEKDIDPQSVKISILANDNCKMWGSFYSSTTKLFVLEGREFCPPPKASEQGRWVKDSYAGWSCPANHEQPVAINDCPVIPIPT